MRPLKVALVCQWYNPEPVHQPRWIVEALIRLQASVQVLTGIPNYPAGRVLAGYRAWSLRREMVDGVMVRRTPLYPSHSSGALGRVCNYMSWAVSSALFGQAVLRSADVALVYSSPATAALAAMVGRHLHGTPYVLFMQDVWPDSITASGSLSGRGGRWILPLVSGFTSRAYHDAAKVVVTSPGMKRLLHSRGVPEEKLSLAYNWVQPLAETVASAGAQFRAELGLDADDFLLMYAGNLGAAQDLQAAILGMSIVDPSERCHLVLVGEGVEKLALQELAIRCCPGRVHFVDPQPRSSMASVMVAADVQLVALADQPLFRVTTPSKLQSILAAGQPVLALACGDVATLVLEAGAGVAVEPGRPNEFAEALQRLRAMSTDDLRAMGIHGRTFYEEHMSESTGAIRLIEALREAVDESVGRLTLGRHPQINQGWN
jgi:colanic acid biosynthesis glycosyl transferase WcaI